MRRRKEKRDENGFEERGGYMNAKKAKLIEQFNVDSAKEGLKIDDLFRDIKIFVNGYTDPSADDLRILMIKHGGQYHHYLKNGDTTHIIASNLPDSKASMTKKHKIVNPSWITDSIKSKRVLDYRDYLLITNQSKSQNALYFSRKAPETTIKTSMKSATDNDFINEFYANSRLHHISTMGATFKEYINQLRSDKNRILPGMTFLLENYPPTNDLRFFDDKMVMHIDMDCFFVSVGIRKNPHLIGKPVAVTHSRSGASNFREGVNLLKEIEAYRKKLGYDLDEPGGSKTSKFSTSGSMAEIASCSYEARKFGIKNGMLIGAALKLCPDLQFIHYDFEAYKEVSYILYDSVSKYTLDIEAVSCDELYADLTNIFKRTSVLPMDFATLIRNEILQKTGCPSSVGFGKNKLIAKLATKKAKPNGQFWIKNEQIDSFLSSMVVAELPGVGRSMSHKMRELGINTCHDLQLWSLSELQEHFGKKQGEILYNICRGIELKGLIFDHVRKSVSADINYGIRLRNDAERDTFLTNLCKELANRLDSIHMKGKCLTVKLMVRSKEAPKESAKYMGHGVCDHITKSSSLLSPISTADEIYKEVQKVMKRLNVDSQELRGMGIQMSRLSNNSSCGTLRNFLSSNFKKNDKPKETHVSCPLAVSQPVVTKLQTAQVSKNEISVEQSGNTLVTEKAPLTGFEFESILPPSDLRVMIKKWVEFEATPKRKDMKIILRYLLNLCSSEQIEEVFITLNAFFVYVKRYKYVTQWMDAYQYVCESIQKTVELKYGGRLKIGNFNFG